MVVARKSEKVSNYSCGSENFSLTPFYSKCSKTGESGLGLLRALVMDLDDGPAIVEAARNLTPAGLLLNAPRPNLLRFMPALNVTAAEIETMLGLLDELIVAVRKA